MLQCYKEILYKGKNNAGWNPKESAECRPFKEGSEFQAGPSSFQHTHTHTHTPHTKCKITVWYTLKGKIN